MAEISLSRSVDRAWDFYGAASTALADSNLEQQLRDDIVAAGFTLAVDPPQFYRFKGGGNGISFAAILMESHAAIHTAPEKNCLEITIHTCEVDGVVVEKTPVQKTQALYDIWVARFKPTYIVQHPERERGNAVF